MREQFPWFLDPTEEELQRLWDEATFSFDANVLLNLYRVDRGTTEDYFKIFRELGDRLFLPHEAANQFFLNRRRVIRTEQNSFSEAKRRVLNWVERRTGFDNLKSQLTGVDIGQIIEEEIESVFEEREGYEKEVEEVKNDLINRIEDLRERFTPTGTTRANSERDEILEELMDIFEGKTGDALDEEMEDLKEDARERYEDGQPPGYEDYDDKGELSRGECEDFLIWKQLMEFADREGEDVVFITGEKKPDWWELDEEYEPLRPRHELLREFRRETGRALWILTTKRLVNNADNRLETKVKQKSKEQTRIIQIKRRSNSKDIINKLDKLKVYKNTIENLKNMIGGEFTRSAKRKIEEKLDLIDIIIRDIKSKSDVIAKSEREVVYNNVKEVRDSMENGKINNIIEYTEKLIGSIEALVEVAENEVQSV